jgi:hypothetical protein
MVPEPGLRFTVERTVEVARSAIPGVLVECGVWRGGCSLAMLRAQEETFGHVRRCVYLLDSFEGLPPVTARDGPLAQQWQSATEAPDYYDNCRASVAEVRRALDAFGFTARDYEIVDGWFDETLPGLAERLSAAGIALLRIDADWYEPTLACLDHLLPIVSPGGFVIVDYYYAWDGCARAVHEFLGRHDLPYRIRSIPGFAGAYFVKSHRETFDVL